MVEDDRGSAEMLPLASGAARGGLETTGGLLLHLCTLLRRLAAPRCTAALVRAADTHYDAPAPLPGTARCCCAVPARHVCRQRAPAGLLVNLRVFSGVGAVPVHASTVPSADLPLLAEPLLGVDTSKDRSSGRPRGLLYPSRLFSCPCSDI
jgi:hypothetical protein